MSQPSNITRCRNPEHYAMPQPSNPEHYTMSQPSNPEHYAMSQPSNPEHYAMSQPSNPEHYAMSQLGKPEHYDNKEERIISPVSDRPFSLKRNKKEVRHFWLPPPSTWDVWFSGNKTVHIFKKGVLSFSFPWVRICHSVQWLSHGLNYLVKGIQSPLGAETVSPPQHPNQLCRPSRLVFNRYRRFFPWE